MVNVLYTTERSFNSRSRHEIFRYKTPGSNEEKPAVTQRMSEANLLTETLKLSAENGNTQVKYQYLEIWKITSCSRLSVWGRGGWNVSLWCLMSDLLRPSKYCTCVQTGGTSTWCEYLHFYPELHFRGKKSVFTQLRLSDSFNFQITLQYIFWGGTTFRGGLIHVWCSGECLWQQDGVCVSKQTTACVFMVMKEQQCNSTTRRKKMHVIQTQYSVFGLSLIFRLKSYILSLMMSDLSLVLVNINTSLSSTSGSEGLL